MATAARTLPWGYGAKEIKLGDRRNDLGIQAGRKLILICRIDGKSNIEQYHYITKQNQQYISQISLNIQTLERKPFKTEYPKAEFYGEHYLNRARGAKSPFF
ncbi:hypothetical protein [Acidovorax sp.]|jgi:hypothetical protein|uniref:hypothetical protein n=1 Tax=Acidovorax sp. TaxID=1872122 RepID=UPI0025BCC50B|nr:hypothetical protein [Acidovorax sp.]